MAGYETRREFVGTAARACMTVAVGSLTAGLVPKPARSSPLNTVDAIDPAAIRKFAGSVKGRVILPADQDYEAARQVWNHAFAKHPGLIVRCAESADVARAVQFARDRDLLVAIRSGGHSLAGKSTCDGGMVIDLSAMKKLTIDTERRIARAEPGILLGEFDAATQAVGLATTLGTEPSTGIAGLTLGGGLGWLMGKYGLACDNLREVEFVTADGSVVTASPAANQDLYWAARGAGANFGVATALEYQLHPVGQVLAGVLKYPPARLRDVLKMYREFTQTIPDEVSLEVGIIPGMNTLPTPSIAVCYCGDFAEGEKVLKPLRSFGPPVADSIRPMPYFDFQKLGAMPADFKTSTIVHSSIVSDVGDDMIDAIVANAATVPSLGGSFVIEQLHGAACRPGSGDTAFPHRSPGYSFALHAYWWDAAAADRVRAWGTSFWEAIRPFVSEKAYSNYLGDEGPDRARAAYGANYQRLAGMKKRYDPTNFFRLNQNIVPEA